nr:immunoglobulin heavy chain junction region [Macaca mulatta]
CVGDGYGRGLDYW